MREDRKTSTMFFLFMDPCGSDQSRHVDDFRAKKSIYYVFVTGDFLFTNMDHAMEPVRKYVHRLGMNRESGHAKFTWPLPF